MIKSAVISASVAAWRMGALTARAAAIAARTCAGTSFTVCAWTRSVRSPASPPCVAAAVCSVAISVFVSANSLGLVTRVEFCARRLSAACTALACASGAGADGVLSAVLNGRDEGEISMNRRSGFCGFGVMIARQREAAVNGWFGAWRWLRCAGRNASLPVPGPRWPFLLSRRI